MIDCEKMQNDFEFGPINEAAAPKVMEIVIIYAQ